jgi:hypothetical protein
MTFSKLIAFERLFDRSVVVFFVGMGVALAGATAFIGG